MSDKYLWCVCVCFSGESGAGKTESTKLLLQFLSVMSQNSAGAPEKATCVEKAIMQSRSTHKHINTHATTTQCEKSQFCCSVCELFTCLYAVCAVCLRNHFLSWPLCFPKPDHGSVWKRQNCLQQQFQSLRKVHPASFQSEREHPRRLHR